MPAAWECRLGNPEPIGSYLALTFSSGTRPTISRKPLSAFATRRIHKLKNLQRQRVATTISARNTERNDAGRIVVIVRVDGVLARKRPDLELTASRWGGDRALLALLRRGSRLRAAPIGAASGAPGPRQGRLRRGELLLGGAWPTPWTGRSCCFAEPPAAAEAFAVADPYVTNGLVTRWQVRAWTTVVGDGAAVPLAV